MPQYKLLTTSYVPRRPGETPELLPAGTEITFDGNPGTNLDAMDDDGAAKQAAYFRSKGITREIAIRRAKVLTEGGFDSEGAMAKLMGEPPAPTKPIEGGTPQPVTAHIPIPDYWEKLPPEKLIELAAKLGAPIETTTKAEARDWIRREVEARALTAKG